jgi:hypothetical protein
MTETPVDEWWEVLRPFFESPKTSEPNIEALVRLLRKNNEPVDGGVRWAIAEILDSRLPHRLACNWELQPVFVGRYDDELLREKKERLIDEAMAAEPNVTDAMDAVDDRDVPGMKKRTAWKVWEKMKPRREWWDKMLEANEPDEDVKASVRRMWRIRGP